MWKATYLNVLTSWKLMSVLHLIALAGAVTVNFVDTKSDFDTIMANFDLANNSWITVVGIAGVVATAIMLLCILYGVLYDPGRWENIGDWKPSLARVMLHVGNEVAVISTIAIGSVYFYIHQGSPDDSLAGSSWAIVLGAVAIGCILIDRIFFTPYLLYLEILASPCLSTFSSNTKLTYSNTVRQPSAYVLYARRLYPQLPQFHMMYSDAACCEGVPLTELCHGSHTPQGGEEAAKTLIATLERKYGLEARTQEHAGSFA
jgi:NADH:ubiquinone oxidoreductase subunit 5 (subunit L)/multisubunit Na+/H+ antiporter MnhA subunit